MVKNLPCNAGEVGSIPGWGTKIPQAVGQLSPGATSKDPMGHKKILCATSKTQRSHINRYIF